MVDTDDLVQVAVLRALNKVGRFEPHREGAFLAYLRRILLNAVRDEIRRVARRPGMEDLPADLADGARLQSSRRSDARRCRRTKRRWPS